MKSDVTLAFPVALSLALIGSVSVALIGSALSRSSTAPCRAHPQRPVALIHSALSRSSTAPCHADRQRPVALPRRPVALIGVTPRQQHPREDSASLVPCKL
jgi:hypothetical protein